MREQKQGGTRWQAAYEDLCRLKGGGSLRLFMAGWWCLVRRRGSSGSTLRQCEVMGSVMHSTVFPRMNAGCRSLSRRKARVSDTQWRSGLLAQNLSWPGGVSCGLMSCVHQLAWQQASDGPHATKQDRRHGSGVVWVGALISPRCTGHEQPQAGLAPRSSAKRWPGSTTSAIVRDVCADKPAGASCDQQQVWRFYSLALPLSQIPLVFPAY